MDMGASPADPFEHLEEGGQARVVGPDLAADAMPDATISKLIISP